MRGPALAVSNNGTELREQLADQSPWLRCGQRPPPLLPSSGLASLSPSAGRFLPPRPWLGGAVSPRSPGKFARGISAAGSRQPGSPAAFGERRDWWPFCWRRRGRRAFVLS